jgi:hypothetical protein
MTLVLSECDSFNAFYHPSFHSVSLCLNIATTVAKYLRPSPRPGGG